VGTFTALTPLQSLTASPYAIRALNVGTNGLAAGVYANAVSFNNPANSFTGNGTGLTNVNAASLGGLGVGNFWQTSGNAGTTAGANFLGTTDNQPLELKVNGARALRLESTAGAPNVIGGAADNQITAPSTGGGVLSGASHRIFNASDYSVIVGGLSNVVQISSPGGALGGGQFNRISNSSTNSVIAGGAFNQVSRDHSVIGGGLRQTNRSEFAFIGGGQENRINFASAHATIAGGISNTIADNSTFSAIAGGEGNNIDTGVGYGAIGGGRINAIAADALGATIAGGQLNRIGTNSGFSAIGGGSLNDVAPESSATTIGGGWGNEIGTGAPYSVISGGNQNEIKPGADRSSIGGGDRNAIQTNAIYSTIGGGRDNSIVTDADYATIPGGRENSAAGYAFAAGHRAKANHEGAFVWADAQDADFVSSTFNQFSIRASGGMRLSDDTPDLSFGSSTRQMIRLYGSTYAIGVQSTCLYQRSNGDFSWFQGGIHSDTRNDPGAGGVEMMRLRTSGLTVNGAFIGASDRNLKENFKPVDPQAVLEKVAALPLSEWNYKTDTTARHVGPMAQDFHAAFGIGPDDKHIATVDADGVALAAIQGLNQKLTEELNRRDAENAELKSRLERLERLISDQKAVRN
jgi:hypothetical protein